MDLKQDAFADKKVVYGTIIASGVFKVGMGFAALEILEASDGTTHVCVCCTRTSTERPERIRDSSHVLSFMHFFSPRVGRIFQWTRVTA